MPVDLIDRARRGAIQWGGGLTLPIAARSFTAAEIGARNNSQATLLRLLTYPLILLFAVLAVRDWLRGGTDRVFLAPVVVLAAFAAFFFTRRLGARQRGYRDPQIEIVVGEDGIALRRPGAAEQIAYEAAAVGLKLVPGGELGPRFDGIRLATPFGPIDLDDHTYLNGGAAAGAIVARVAALGRELPVAELPII